MRLPSLFLSSLLGVAAFGALICSSSIINAEPVAYAKPPETARFKPGENSVKAIGHCSLCHSADYISTQPPLSRTAWKAIVVKMQKVHGAPIPEADVEPIVDYLAKVYGTEKAAEIKPSTTK